MFVNKQHINGKKRFSVLLKDGDELALLSPSSGG
ncbi:MoaD/ThiS family protein [Desulfosporosinus shakirovi]|nr:MoaD/ThiS family protein [Desulfosporosinus sp. SRJS8]